MQDIPLASRRHDDALMVKGDVHAVQGLLDRPEALGALDRVADGGGRLVFSKGLFTFMNSAFSGLGRREASADTVRDLVEASSPSTIPQCPWQDAAQELGLRYLEPDRTARLEGTLSGLEVRIKAEPTPSTTRFRVRLRGGLPHGVRLRAGKGSIQFETRSWMAGSRSPPPVPGRPSGRRVCASSRPRYRPRARPSRLPDGRAAGMEGAAVEDGNVTLEHAGRAGPELVDVIRRPTALEVALSDSEETSGGWAVAWRDWWAVSSCLR